MTNSSSTSSKSSQVSTHQVTARSESKSEQSSVFKVGGVFFRIDSASIEAVAKPHVAAQELVAKTQGTTSELDRLAANDLNPSSISTAMTETVPMETPVTMGIGDVVQNNSVFQQIAKDMGDTKVGGTDDQAGPLNIRASWEVDRFRWPRLAKRFLISQPALFNQIGGSLLQAMEPTRSRIGICSTHRREGKSTIAICLARWAALQGKRALVIDADVENPQLTIMSGLNTSFGWKSALNNDIPLSEIMVRSSESSLVMIPAYPLGRPRIYEKSLDRLATITFQLKYEFDLVVIDTGTIENICVHGKEGMDLFDRMLIVRDSTRTSVGQLMETKQILKNLGIARTSVAENFVGRRSA